MVCDDSNCLPPSSEELSFEIPNSKKLAVAENTTAVKRGVENIKNRDEELLDLCYSEFQKIEGLIILGDTESERIGCVSFTIENIHYNLIVRLLNDRFGIQVRGGWSCASTYAHYLFDINQQESEKITNELLQKNLSNKPGWVRISLHPTMTNEELLFICDAIQKVVIHYEEWQKAYEYNVSTNEFENVLVEETISEDVKGWFSLD